LVHKGGPKRGSKMRGPTMGSGKRCLPRGSSNVGLRRVLP
jgi:hypothetical protein